MLHLQLDTGSFLPACAIAIRWQVWTTLLVYVLLRFARLLEPVGPQLHPALPGGYRPRNRRGSPDSGHP